MGDATSKLVRGLLEVFLLDAIAREPRHGYALIQELDRVFGAEPNRNQVYPLLNRLERDGYLHADRGEGRGRTRYALTGKGLELLKEYRLRTPEFRARALALWAPGGEGAPSPAAPPAEPAPAERLLEHVAVEGRAIDAPRAGSAHGGGPCTAEVALRRRVAGDRLALELTGLDPACPACRELAAPLRGFRDRWPGL